MVTTGVVWCFKDNKWFPLQLSSIRLQGALTQAHLTVVSDFLQRVANKELILQDNGFTELTEKHKQLLLQQEKKLGVLELTNSDVIKHTDNVLVERKTSLGQIPEDKVVEQKRRPSMPDLRTVDRQSNLFINNLLNKNETDRKENKTDFISNENDEIVLRLLKKYCKYSKNSLDEEILHAIEQIPDDQITQPPRNRKLSYIPTHLSSKEEKLYENCLDVTRSPQDDSIENQRNEHLIRWLKQQNPQHGITEIQLPTRRHSSFEISSPTDSRKCGSIERKSSSSGFVSRKSSLTASSTPESVKSDSRKSSVSSTLTSRKSSLGSTSSLSEGEELGGNASSHWTKLLMKYAGDKKAEKKIKKQREAWARNRRKLSSNSNIELQRRDILHKP
ncbi:hypothetical protein WA026_018639 [Henosepilachna vigintioctopunctata]|uniref:Uncharacterized protein n=1 Tax=Henosepilachna vigintioctopunctata TaxID=420089 RepID=A0AAW1UBK4_9CUCU